MIKHASPAAIIDAASLLRQGKIVAFPTETVFGMGADATNSLAVSALFHLKNRPIGKPFSIMPPDLATAEQIAVFDERALTLAHTIWPGPLSMVLPLRDIHGLCPEASGKDGTISLRIPKHPVALALLKETGRPLTVPSANSSGQLSTTNAGDVAKDFGDALPVILADGTRILGLESTIIDLTVTPAKIIRLGALTIEEIESLIGPVEFDATPVASVTLRTPLRLDAIDVKQGEAFLGFGNTGFIGVEGVGFAKDMPHHLWRNLSVNGDLHEAATNLYTMLHELDQSGATRIAVMRIPNAGLGMTINDRLARITLRKE
jgi:L-threonylcarbamoyladenylate synthase